MAHLVPLLTGVLAPLDRARLLTSWYLAPVPLVVLAAALVAYLWGAHRVTRVRRRPWPAARTWAFVGGIAVTFVSVSSFLGAYDTTLFWVHMVQHLLLIMVAAILFAASAPVGLLFHATTGEAHRRVVAALRSRAATVLGHPITAFVLYGVLVPLTHLTVFFNWAVEYRALDDVEHLLFVVIGYMFWRQIIGADPNRYRTHPALRALLLFLAVPVDTFVGLSLDSETHEIFPAFAAEHRHWGMSLVYDLHVGGVIMWVGGDSLMMLALIPVVVQWVRLEERRGTRFDKELDQFFPPPEHAGQPTAGFALGTYRPRRGRRTASPLAAGEGAPGPSG